MLAAALLVRVGMLFNAHGYLVDDAYIFMRYADNFANGQGLVYNPGEVVLGFTSAFYVVILSIGTSMLPHVGIPVIVTVVNLAFFLGFAWAMLRIFADVGAWSWMAPCFLFFYFPYIDASINGMETSAMTAFLAFTLLALRENKDDLALVLATVTATIRPEGFLWLFAVCSYCLLVRKKRFRVSFLGASLCILLLWAVPLYLYYGTILPQSMLAKSSLGAAEKWGGHTTSVFEKYALLATGLGDRGYASLPRFAQLVLNLGCGAVLLLLVLEMVRQFRECSFLLVASLFFFFCLAFYHIGNPVRIFSWYTIPTSMMCVVSTSSGVRRLFPRVESWTFGAPALIAVFLLSVASVGVGILGRNAGMASSVAEYQGIVDFIHRRVPNADSVMISQIGLVGYRSKLRIIDLAGLVSPSVFHAEHGEEARFLSDMIQEEKPSVLCFQEDILANRIIRDGAILHRTFRNEAAKEEFLQDYVQPEDARGVYSHVFVRRNLLVAPDR